MPSWLLGLGKGLVLGFAGTGVNYYFLRRTFRKIKTKPRENAEKIMLRCYSGRYVVNLATLVAACFLFSSDMAALLGAALGLTLPNFVLFLTPYGKKFD